MIAFHCMAFNQPGSNAEGTGWRAERQYHIKVECVNSSEGKGILAVRSQGIPTTLKGKVSQQKYYSSTLLWRKLLQHCSPKETFLRGSVAVLLTPGKANMTLLCSVKVITALLPSARAKENHYKSHSRDLLRGRNPGEWLPLPRVEKGQPQTEQIQGLYRIS